MPLNLVALELLCWLQQRKKQERITGRRKEAAEAAAEEKQQKAEHVAWQKRQVCAVV